MNEANLLVAGVTGNQDTSDTDHATTPSERLPFGVTARNTVTTKIRAAGAILGRLRLHDRVGAVSGTDELASVARPNRGKPRCRTPAAVCGT